MFDISLALKNPGQTYPFEESIALPPMDVLGEEIAFEGALFKGEYLGAGESVSVRGEASAQVLAACARCLEPVRFELSARVDEAFVRPENAAEDADVYPIDGTSINLAEMVKDALLLNLPMRFLCSEDCRGLCPVCGQNRNRNSCACLEGDGDNPFSALKDLFN